MRVIVLSLAFLLAFALTDGYGDMWTVLTAGTDVMCIARDGDYMWCGGTFGATRLDRWGFTKDTYTSANGLAGHPVTGIAIGPDGRKWFATWSAGLSCLDGESWTTYNMDNSGLESNHLVDLAIDQQGRVWIACDANLGDKREGVCVFDGQSWTEYNSQNSGLVYDGVRDLAIDQEGKKWFVTGCGVSMFDDVTWVTYNTSNSGLVDDYVNSVAVDSVGRKWFGTHFGISVFDGDRWQTLNEDNSGLPSNSVGCIGFDSSGHLWADAGGGLCFYDWSNWTTYNPENSGLLDAWIKSIGFDAGGHTWVGSQAGLCVFDGTTWAQLNPGNSGMADSPIVPFHEDSLGRIWSKIYGNSGYNCISVLDGDAWATYDISNSEMPYQQIGGVAIDKDGWAWISTWDEKYGGFGDYECYGGGLSSFDGFKWTRYSPTNSGLAWDFVQDIAIDSAGRKWLAATDAAHCNPYARRRGSVQSGVCGVSVLDGDNWTNYDSTNSGLPPTGVRKIAIDKQDRKWFVLNEGGLCVFNGANWTTYNTSNSLIPTNSISGIDFDSQNRMWFVDGGRIVGVFDGAVWVTYDPPAAPGDFFELDSVAVDRADKKWFVGISGVFSFDGQTWKQYDSSNSGIAYDSYMFGLFVDSHNRKWFSGVYGGVSILTEGAPSGGTPPSEPSNPHPPDGGANSDWPVTLSWDCEDPDPGDRITYDLAMLTGGGMGMEWTTIAWDLTKSEYQMFSSSGGDVMWGVIAHDTQGNQTSGPYWDFEASRSSYSMTIESARLEPESPVAGQPAILYLTLTNDGWWMQNAVCVLSLEARYHGGYSSYDVTWWTDGDMLFELSDVDSGETIEIEREIVIMASPDVVDNLGISLYLQDPRYRVSRCAGRELPVTLTPNPDEYVNAITGALSVMTERFDIGRGGYDYSRRTQYLYPQRLFQSRTPTYCASAMAVALSRRDMEALGKYYAQLLASYADTLCVDGSGLNHSGLAQWALTYLRRAIEEPSMAAMPASDLREFVCSFVRHYNLFTTPKVERRGYGAANTILAFFCPDEADALPTCFAFDGDSGEITNMKPERTGTYSLDLLLVRSNGVETLSRFAGIQLQADSIVTIKALSSDANELKVCLDADTNGIFDRIVEPSSVQTTPAYPIQSLGWSKAEAPIVGEVKVTFTLVNPGPAQDIDIYIACDLGDGRLLFYPAFTPDLCGIPFAAPVHFYLDRFSLIEAQIPYGLAIEPIHFYCGISSPDEFRLLRPIDIL
ncbi:MAG: hypothetical protein JW759_00245 [Candidatus Coatesbacteria bacterium]|nr:hypothetical protein [Candidatus Coatesbacteria bacterium]